MHHRAARAGRDAAEEQPRRRAREPAPAEAAPADEVRQDGAHDGAAAELEPEGGGVAHVRVARAVRDEHLRRVRCAGMGAAACAVWEEMAGGRGHNACSLVQSGAGRGGCVGRGQRASTLCAFASRGSAELSTPPRWRTRGHAVEVHMGLKVGFAGALLAGDCGMTMSEMRELPSKRREEST